ncbi:MAG: dihydrolipoamide acyltransferase [Flavobacteriales bacterium]|jgi:pyruvate dehydrogenase E2 component (dihydrolipoamide acetyltransferase)|nr:dihydrolipoamide acyltransferase [Flavobacteriales bacterium]|tara:strand:- start:2557 stop:3789 length:1233 start_codon:yes stop_codon:yes gene_type:complete
MAEIIKMPRLSDTMTDGVVAKWHKKIGDKIQEGDLLADIETDKATMEFESFQEGTLLYIGVQQNETAKVDSILAILGDKDENIDKLLSLENNNDVHNNNNESTTQIEPSVDLTAKLETHTSSQDILNTSPADRIKISPLAKKIAQEKNIDITIISGSGEGGRIVKRDLEKIDSINETEQVLSHALEDKKIPVSQMRKKIAERLSDSKFKAPHFYLNIEVNVDNLIENRKIINEKNNVKISFNDIIVKAVSMAIKKHPVINSSWLDTHIKFHKDINIGIAVSVENGLIVPVIKNADFKSFTDISTETRALIQKAQDNKLQPDDWESNTFTISNLGMFGIDDFTAIINPDDACILAVGAIKQRAVVENGVIVPANIIRLTLSCDHRVVDGVEGAKFLSTLKNMLESPLMMFC